MLREIGERIWMAEAPLRTLGVSVGRRMGVVQLASGDLFVHSPAPLEADLRGALDVLGPLRFVAAASALHGHLFMEQYRNAYPDAELLAPPGLERRRPDLSFQATLGDVPDPRLAGDLDQALFRGNRFLCEVVFFHRASRSLLVGDVVWNVTPALPPGARLWAGWRPGVRPTPFFRATIRDRAAARRSVDRILAWDFERIVIGHGEMVDADAHEAFRRAYAWLG